MSGIRDGDPAVELGAVEFDGIQFAAIGDDGDRLVAFGHHDPALLARAMSRFARQYLGWTEDVEVEDLKVRWGQLLTGRGEAWLDYSAKAEAPGAFPVMLADFS